MTTLSLRILRDFRTNYPNYVGIQKLKFVKTSMLVASRSARARRLKTLHVHHRSATQWWIHWGVQGVRTPLTLPQGCIAWGVKIEAKSQNFTTKI